MSDPKRVLETSRHSAAPAAATERPLTRAERHAVERVLSEHHRFIESVAAQHAPSPAAVPDIVQNVSLTLCRKLHTFEGRSRLSTWIVRITINEARMARRREQRRAVHEEYWEQTRADGLNPAAASQRQSRFLRAWGLSASHTATEGPARPPRLVRRTRE